MSNPDPKGPSSPHVWFLVPKEVLQSCNREYLDPLEAACLILSIDEPLAFSYRTKVFRGSLTPGAHGVESCAQFRLSLGVI